MYFKEVEPLQEASYSVLSLFGGNAWYPMTMVQSNKEIKAAQTAFNVTYKINKQAENKLALYLDKIFKGDINKPQPINLIDIDGYLNARRRMDISIRGYNKEANKAVMDTSRKDFYGTMTYPLFKEMLRSYIYSKENIKNSLSIPYILKDKYLIYITFDNKNILLLSYVSAENYKDPMCPIELAILTDGEPIKYNDFKK